MAQVVSEDFTVARDGLTLQGHVEYPQGSTHDRVVICMHGFLRDMGVKPGELYQDISDALTAHGMTCVRFDFNGRGRSEGAFEDSDVFNQIEDAIAVLNHVRDAYDPLEISLLGHSQGGVVAGMTAGMFSDVIHTLFMLAPAASLKDDALRGELLALVGTDVDRSLEAEKPGAKKPSVIIMVGVNGTGKTTTAGKLARLFVSEDKTVMLGAADTFRAAAADQLETWGAKVDVPVVRSDKEGADPASVAFEAAAKAKDDDVDVLIIDTAGRLQNKANLMDELGKIRRVTEKNLPVDEVLLVLDATTGQNGMAQAKVFAEAIGITGVVLTKLDGSAKGGIVISVQKELGVPVKLVGVGEGPDDLAPFDPESFVDGILG